MRETSIPQLPSITSSSKDINSIDLDVLNVSKHTEKKRHSFSIAQKKNKDSNFKNRPFSSFNYGSFKRKCHRFPENPIRRF